MPLCVRGNQRPSNVSAINPAVNSTVNSAIDPAVNPAGAAQNSDIAPPPGYSEVCGNQPGHHSQMGLVGQTWHNPTPITGQNMEELSGQTAPGLTAAAGQNQPGVMYNSYDATGGVTYDPYAATGGYPTRRQTKDFSVSRPRCHLR